MNGNDVDLLEMSYDDINSMRKKNLVEQIEKMKGQVIFDSHVKDLCNQIEKLTESLNQVTAANEKNTSELVIVKNVNVNLENRTLILKSYKPKLSSIIEGTTLKYQEYRTKYMIRFLKTMLSRFVKILTLK